MEYIFEFGYVAVVALLAILSFGRSFDGSDSGVDTEHLIFSAHYTPLTVVVKDEQEMFVPYVAKLAVR